MPHKITNIRVQNVKGIKYIELDVSGRPVTIVGGMNEQGKSSFVDSVAMAIGGPRLFPDKPLRNGEERGCIEIKLDGESDLLPGPCTITRYLERRDDDREYTQSLEIKAEDGELAPTPQTILNDMLVKGVGFDPLAFSKADPVEQVGIALDVLGIDFSELDKQRAEAYEERTEVNREGKALKNLVDGMPIHEDVPENVEDTTKLATEMQQAFTWEGNYLHYESRINDLEKEIKEKQVELMAAQLELEELNKTTPQRSGKACKHALDMSLEAQGKYADMKRRAKHEEELQEKREKSAALTARIKEIDHKKHEITAAASWPVDGLAFTKDGVAYNGVPLGQCSTAKQVEVSTAMSMLMNPNFKFAIIREGSLLDQSHLASVCQIVHDAEGQVFIEKVGEEGCDVIIRDGEIVQS